MVYRSTAAAPSCACVRVCAVGATGDDGHGSRAVRRRWAHVRHYRFRRRGQQGNGGCSCRLRLGARRPHRPVVSGRGARVGRCAHQNAPASVARQEIKQKAARPRREKDSGTAAAAAGARLELRTAAAVIDSSHLARRCSRSQCSSASSGFFINTDTAPSTVIHGNRSRRFNVRRHARLSRAPAASPTAVDPVGQRASRSSSNRPRIAAR